MDATHTEESKAMTNLNEKLAEQKAIQAKLEEAKIEAERALSECNKSVLLLEIAIAKKIKADLLAAAAPKKEASNVVELPKPVKGLIRVRDIPRKSWTMHGVTREQEPMTGHHADIVPGKSIRIFGTETNHINGPFDYDKTFVIGDKVEYDSYNLHYFGEIVSIGKKTVTIKPRCGSSKRRLDIATFSRRNSGDMDRKIFNNQNWMD